VTDLLTTTDGNGALVRSNTWGLDAMAIVSGCCFELHVLNTRLEM